MARLASRGAGRRRHPPRFLLASLLTVVALVALFEFAWREDVLGWGVLEAQVPQAPVHPLLNLTSAPSVATVEVAYGSGALPADVYTPNGDGPWGGIELVNGVEPEGRRLAEFVNLADALSRAGYVVIAPDIPGLVHETVTPKDVDAVVAAFVALRQRPRVDPRHVGMIGFSIGASLELVAAADPRIRGDVRVVDDVGGYSRLTDIVEIATTHSVITNNAVVPFVPNPYVWVVGRNSLIAMLPDASDRLALRSMFPSDRPDPISGQVGSVDALSASGRTMYELFTNRDARKVAGIVQRLPAEVQGDMRALSPDSHIGQVAAIVHIVHDRGDPFIPVQESRILVADPGIRGHASLLELDVLQHVELAAPDLSPARLLGFYVPQMARLNGYVRDTLTWLRSGSD